MRMGLKNKPWGGIIIWKKRCSFPLTLNVCEKEVFPHFELMKLYKLLEWLTNMIVWQRCSSRSNEQAEASAFHWHS